MGFLSLAIFELWSTYVSRTAFVDSTLFECLVLLRRVKALLPIRFLGMVPRDRIHRSLHETHFPMYGQRDKVPCCLIGAFFACVPWCDRDALSIAVTTV